MFFSRLFDVVSARRTHHELHLMLIFEHVDQDLAQYLEKQSSSLSPECVQACITFASRSIYRHHHAHTVITKHVKTTLCYQQYFNLLLGRSDFGVKCLSTSGGMGRELRRVPWAGWPAVITRVRTIPKKAPNNIGLSQCQYQYWCVKKHWIECKSKTVQVNTVYYTYYSHVLSRI